MKLNTSFLLHINKKKIMSDLNIFLASGGGDLNRVKYLVETENIDVNSKDSVIK